MQRRYPGSILFGDGVKLSEMPKSKEDDEERTAELLREAYAHREYPELGAWARMLPDSKDDDEEEEDKEGARE